MFGEILKERRIELGRDLKESADILRIRYEYLKSLEENSFNKLPPEVYTKGYIREYARFLGIDPEPLIKAYSEQQTATYDDIQIKPPPPRKRFAFPRILLLISPVLIIAAGIIISFQNTTTTRNENKAVPTLPLPASVHPLNPSPQQKPQPPSQRDYQLNATAIETTWLRIEMDEGKSEEVLFNPGESKKWLSQNGFVLKIGNAGGIRLIFNDKDLGVMGQRGQVLLLRLPQEETSQSPSVDNR